MCAADTANTCRYEALGIHERNAVHTSVNWTLKADFTLVGFLRRKNFSKLTSTSLSGLYSSVFRLEIKVDINQGYNAV